MMKKKIKKDSHVLGVVLTAKLYRSIASIAAKEERSFSFIIRELLNEALDQRKREARN